MLTPHALTRLCRARDELRDTLASPVSIHHVAQAAGMSPYHFIRRFEAVFGETPHQFRTCARLERAKHLLALSNQSVTDVCMEIGFASLGSFSTLFAQRVGVAPSLYRRQIQALVPVAADLTRQLYPGCFALMSRLPSLRTFREVSGSPQV